MSNYGITEDGFKRKTRKDIVDDLILKTKSVMGDDFNTSDRNPWIKFLKIIAYPISLYWMALESLYNNRWIGTATGQTLDEVVQYLGLSRKEGTRAVVDLKFEGDNLTYIPEDFIIETNEKEPVRFKTLVSGYIENGDPLILQTRAIDKGFRGNVDPNTLTEIVNPISGLDSVTNPLAAQGGSDREEDWELRARYYDSYDRAGGSTVTAIRANVLETTSVTACIVLENDTMVVDSNGLPEKSFETIVYGGSDAEITEAIYNKKPAGIESFGSIYNTVEDDIGRIHPIYFSRATPVSVYIDVVITTNSGFPLNGRKQIKKEILSYLNGELSINESVIYTRLFDLIYNVEGVKDVDELYLDNIMNPSKTENLEIGFREVANGVEDRIVIT